MVTWSRQLAVTLDTDVFLAILQCGRSSLVELFSYLQIESSGSFYKRLIKFSLQ